MKRAIRLQMSKNRSHRVATNEQRDDMKQYLLHLTYHRLGLAWVVRTSTEEPAESTGNILRLLLLDPESIFEPFIERCVRKGRFRFDGSDRLRTHHGCFFLNAECVLTNLLPLFLRKLFLIFLHLPYTLEFFFGFEKEFRRPSWPSACLVVVQVHLLKLVLAKRLFQIMVVDFHPVVSKSLLGLSSNTSFLH